MRGLIPWIKNAVGDRHLLQLLAGSAGLRIVGMGFSFLVGIQLARGLGAAGYGVYGVAMAVLAILMIPTELGLPQLVTREVSAAVAADGGGATHAIVRWGTRAVFFSSLAIAATTLFTLAVGFSEMDAELESTLLIGLLWIPLVAIGNIYGAALRGIHRVVAGQLGEFLLRPILVSLMLFVLLFAAGRTISAPFAMSVNVLATAAAAVISILLLRRAGRVGEKNHLPEGLRLGHALPMAMSEGMRVLGTQVGMLVLGVMASKEDAGLYRVAWAIYAVTTMPSALVNVACAPTIARLHTQGKVVELARLNVFVSVLLSVASAVFFGLNMTWGSITVAQLFGQEYQQASAVLAVFLAGELVASLFGHPTVVLNMMRQQKAVMWWSVIALLLNLVVTIFMTRAIGHMGAAFGAATGLVVWRAGCAGFAKARHGMDTSFFTRLFPAHPRDEHGRGR